MIKKSALIILITLISISYGHAQTWSTYYGGNGCDTVNQMIEVDDFIYIVGTTSSPGSIATYDAYQQNLAGGTDCFIAKFDKNGIVFGEHILAVRIMITALRFAIILIKILS